MIDMKVLKKLSNVHVMIVEDDEVIAYGIKQSLQKHCKRVDIAVDGMQGFEMFEKNKPNVLIVDINLPYLNGLEMVSLIRKISPSLPILIMTSEDNPDNMLKSINEGAYIYLRKPVSIEEIQTALLMATKNIYNSYMQLENGYVYDSQNMQLSNEEGKKVSLTKLERNIMHLLILNIDKIVSYSTIESYVWQDKSMSLKTLRMRINHIRQKTYADIIENISGCGYRINKIY